MMFFKSLFLSFLLMLLPLLAISAPVLIPGQITQSESQPQRRHLSIPLSIFKKRSETPSPGLTNADLGKCFFVGSDFQMHDCNAVLAHDSINDPKTPEQFALVSSVSAALAAAKAQQTSS